MPRKSSGGRPARAPACARPARGTPAPVKQAPPPVPAPSSGGSVLGSIGSTIAEGMAFGGGSAVAYRAVDAVMGPRTIRHETVLAAAPEPAATASSNFDACGMHYKAFQDCINSSGSDISKCQFYMDMLSNCRKSSGLAA